jgi:hypothetical protein
MAQQTDYAWAAGFFDGEGCVSLHSQGRYTCLRVIIVQKDIRPIEFFRSVFEMSETIGIVTRQNRKHKYYRLVASGPSAANILRNMLPYLKLKRDVAEVALDFQAAVERYTPKERKATLPDSEMEYRRSLTEKVKWLNSGRWAAAETKPSGLTETSGSDSPNCTDDKRAESAEMPDRVQ